MTIRELQKKAHEIAKEKGWHDKRRSVGDLIALCHSELSEALEVYRQGWPVKQIKTENQDILNLEVWSNGGCQEKPEGFPIELADLIIRVVDMAEALGIDLEKAVEVKMRYNLTRPYRHGGKTL